ncbi:MAG: aldose 1-epimerase family protein [Bacilli bacterium]
MNYSLQNEHLQITVRSYGAELISLKSKQQTEFIWQRNPEFWNRCAPVLFPVVGRLLDKYTMIYGKKYEMDIHGFLKDQEFSLLSQSKNHLSLVHRFNEETVKMYPFHYEFVITYRLREKQVRTEYLIRNLGKDDLFFNVGGHPAINVPLYPNESFCDYTISFEKEETFDAPTIEKNGTLNFDVPAISYSKLKHLPLDRSLFFLDTIVIPKVKSKQVELMNKQHQGIIFRFENFKTLAIWTRYHQQAPFVCLEPWLGYGDRYNSDHDFMKKDYMQKLAFNEQFTAFYEIELME